MDAHATFRVATLNILRDPKHDTWPLRAPLVVAELNALKPDIVLLQEVEWPHEQATELAATLRTETGRKYSTHLTMLHAANGWKEGLAILSHFPVTEFDEFQFPDSEKFCQRVSLVVHEKRIDIYNVHLDPYPNKRVASQVRAIIDWMVQRDGIDGVVWGGDFNASPQSDAIAHLYARFRSTYAIVHGQEPKYTVPTPFRVEQRRQQGLSVDYLTLDYLTISPTLTAVAADVAFADASPNDPLLYPSDHYGLYADIRWAQ